MRYSSYLWEKYKVMAYSKEEIDKIFKIVCKEIEKGEALRNVLKRKDMPSTATFYQWLERYEDNQKQYTRATMLRADSIFDEIVSISDEAKKDIFVNKKGEEVLNSVNIQRDRLRIDARKWVLGKLNPKKYGEHQSVDLTSQGEKLNTTPNITVNVIPPIDED